MALNWSHLRQPQALIRFATLLLGLIGLAFVITDILLQATDVLIGYEAVTYVAIAITSFAWTILWSISAICVLLFKGSYHPGVDVGLDCIGWGLGWGFGVVLIINAADMNYARECQFSYASAHECTLGRALMASEILAGIMALGYGACHLWLLISACKALSTKRRSQRIPDVKLGDRELEDGQQLRGP